MTRNERGFSLIEMLVAITLLALCLVGVAQVTFVMARRAYANSGGQARDAILSQQVNQFGTYTMSRGPSRDAR